MTGLLVLLAFGVGYDAWAIRSGRETVCSGVRRLGRRHPDVRAGLIGAFVVLGFHLFEERQ